MNVWRALITFKWWEFIGTNRKELTLHLFRNKIRINLLKVRGEN